MRRLPSWSKNILAIYYHFLISVQYEIFMHLILDVLCNRFFITANCIHVVPAAPEVPIAVLVFQIGKSLENHQTTLSLEKSHEVRHTTLYKGRK